MITVQKDATNSPFKTVNFSKHPPSILSFSIFSIYHAFLTIPHNLGVTAGQSAYLGGFGITKPTNVLNVELDVEKRMQAEILKRQIRIKEFFHDFDRLRKGTVGEAGVRIHKCM